MFSKVSLETQGNQITVRVYEVKQTRKNKKKIGCLQYTMA